MAPLYKIIQNNNNLNQLKNTHTQKLVLIQLYIYKKFNNLKLYVKKEETEIINFPQNYEIKNLLIVKILTLKYNIYGFMNKYNNSKGDKIICMLSYHIGMSY